MKKVLALVVAFALCFTAFAGCFATSAAAVADFAVVGSTVEAAGGAATVTVSGSYELKTAQLLTVTLAEGLTFVSVEGMDELNAAGDDGDYVVNGQVVKFLDVYTGKFEIVINVTVAENTTEADVTYKVDASAEIATFDDTEATVVATEGVVTVKAKAPEHVCAGLDPVEENRVEPQIGVPGSYDMVVYCECGEELSRETFVIPALEPEVPAKTFTGSLNKVGGTTKFILNAYLDFAVSGFTPDSVKCLVFREAAFDENAEINPSLAGWNVDFPTSGQAVQISGFALAKITEKFVFVLYATEGDTVYYADPIKVAYADYLYGRITTEGVAAATVEKANKILDTYYMIFEKPAYEGQAKPATTFTKAGTYSAVTPTSTEDIGGGFTSVCTYGGTTKYAVNITGDFSNYTGTVKSYGIKVYRGAYVGDYTDVAAWDLSLGTNPALKLTVDGFANITERFIYIPYVVDEDDNVILGSATRISYVDYLVGRLNNATSEATQAKAAAILDMYELINGTDIYTVA